MSNIQNNNEWEEVGAEFNETWNGEDSDLTMGDELVGTVEEIREDIGKFNSTIYVVKDKDDKLWDVWGGAVLNGCLKNVEPGYEVKIVYQGTVPTDKGNPYKDYQVFKRKLSK